MENTMRIKRLSLEPWMKDKMMRNYTLLENKEYFRIRPYFNKDGVYFIQENGRKCTFFEVDGEAWVINNEYYFDNELNILNASEYNKRQINALIIIKEQNLATKEQIRLLYHIFVYNTSRNVGRNTKLFMMKQNDNRT